MPNLPDPPSSFLDWLRSKVELDDHVRASDLKSEALVGLKAAVQSGAITSLDGIESPQSRDILEHHQARTFEMNSNWICSSQDWTCPCCERTKLQISRVGNLRQVLAKLVIHHDHMGEAMKFAFNQALKSEGTQKAQVEGLRLVERMSVAFAAYDEILICEDCNNADSAAKRLLEDAPHFSFSANQIKQFIVVRPHHAHELKPLEVQAAWDAARRSYEFRIKLIKDVAHEAATDAHWFEPSEGRARRVPLLGKRLEPYDSRILRLVSPLDVVDTLGDDTPISKPNRSRWRTETQKTGDSPPENFVAMLSSETVHGRMWTDAAPDWHCPICLRAKEETVYFADKGNVLFVTKTIRPQGLWLTTLKFCNHCHSTLMSLKAEVSDLLGDKIDNSYSFVSPEELATVIVGRPHSSHAIKASEAARLVRDIVAREKSSAS